MQVFDVGSGPEARFFERLHRAMAIFATHDLIAFCEGFLEGAWEPTPTHLYSSTEILDCAQCRMTMQGDGTAECESGFPTGMTSKRV